MSIISGDCNVSSSLGSNVTSSKRPSEAAPCDIAAGCVTLSTGGLGLLPRADFLPPLGLPRPGGREVGLAEGSVVTTLRWGEGLSIGLRLPQS